MQDWLPIIELAWLALLGATVGSFLNVVAFRLPRGQSLVHPGSRCPNCGSAIRWHDNVPVLGWLWLRGKCRDCQASISFRYPLVEAMTAALFALLAWAEVLQPISIASEVGSPPAISAWAVYAFHLTLLMLIWTASLMEFDSQRPPWSLLISALAFSFVAPVIEPELRAPALSQPLPDLLTASPQMLAIVEGLAGMATGALLVCLAWPMLSLGSLGKHGRLVALVELAAIGAALGWQPALVIGYRAWVPLAALILIGLTSDRIGMANISFCLTGTMLALIVGWPQTGAAWPPLEKAAEGMLLAAAGLLMALFALAVRQLHGFFARRFVAR